MVEGITNHRKILSGVTPQKEFIMKLDVMSLVETAVGAHLDLMVEHHRPTIEGLNDTVELFRCIMLQYGMAVEEIHTELISREGKAAVAVTMTVVASDDRIGTHELKCQVWLNDEEMDWSILY